MLTKYSVFMMLLIVTASLIGISSSIYKPASVETQPQSPAQPPPAQKQAQNNIVTQQMGQVIEDKQLLDRLFPQIIQRLDGKTLAAKVLPYLDITATLNTRSGNVVPGSAGTVLLGTQSIGIHSDVRCNNNEQAVGGGFRYSGEVGGSMVYDSTPNGQNGWKTSAMLVEQDGSVQAYVTCLSINVGLKNVQQSQPQQQPSPPPGGPPLQLPPNLR